MKLPAQPGRMTRWLRLARLTVRVRLTLVYVCLFVVSGAALLALNPAVQQSTGASFSAASSASGQPVVQSPPGQNNGSPGIGGGELAAAGAAAIALGIMTLVSIALSWIVAGRVLRPLRTMTATTRQISEHSLDRRLAIRGPSDELKDLGDTIDGLLERLEASFNAQRRFVANASHELRTPHAMIRTSVDVATGKPGPVPPEVMVLADKVREGLDRSDRLLDGLLTLARAQHGAPQDLAMLSLSQVVSDALQGCAEAIAGRELDVRQATSEVRVEGSGTLLYQMVENVIDNAVRHNERGGWIRVQIAAEGPLARLVVETGGPMLDESEVQQLAQPFRRLGAERTGSENGTGLGLSIVAAIAAAHGGALHLHARPQGGLRVDIALPRAVPTAVTGGAA